MLTYLLYLYHTRISCPKKIRDSPTTYTYTHPTAMWVNLTSHIYYMKLLVIMSCSCVALSIMLSGMLFVIYMLIIFLLFFSVLGFVTRRVDQNQRRTILELAMSYYPHGYHTTRLSITHVCETQDITLAVALTWNSLLLSSMSSV